VHEGNIIQGFVKAKGVDVRHDDVSARPLRASTQVKEVANLESLRVGGGAIEFGIFFLLLSMVGNGVRNARHKWRYLQCGSK
jgi:hypothetical protein